VSYLRVKKTPEEIEGMEYALKIESAALIAFYAKLEDDIVNQGASIYENQVPEMLNEMRRKIGQD